MRSCAETTKRKSKERKVSSKAFKFTANLLNNYLKFPSAKNSLYTSNDINQCLIQLSLSQSYSESGLTNLSEKCCTSNNVPTARTFRGRVERLSEKQIRDALIKANDHVLFILRNYCVFRRKAVVAIDYTRQPFYGAIDTKNVIGGKHERGTTWATSTPALTLLKRASTTLYSSTVNQFSENAEVVEKLIFEAKARGIHISIVLLDRAFFTIDVIQTLKRLGVYFIIPAVKHETVKEAMRHYNEKEPAKLLFWVIEGKVSLSICTLQATC